MNTPGPLRSINVGGYGLRGEENLETQL